MTDKNEDKIKIQNLTDNCCCDIDSFDEFGGKVCHIKDKLYLYEILYGAEHFAGVFELNEVDKLLDLAYSWT